MFTISTDLHTVVFKRLETLLSIRMWARSIKFLCLEGVVETFGIMNRYENYEKMGVRFAVLSF